MSNYQTKVYDQPSDSMYDRAVISGPGVLGVAVDAEDAPGVADALERAYNAGRLTVIEQVMKAIEEVTLLPCGCLANSAGAHRVGCPLYPAGRPL